MKKTGDEKPTRAMLSEEIRGLRTTISLLTKDRDHWHDAFYKSRAQYDELVGRFAIAEDVLRQVELKTLGIAVENCVIEEMRDERCKQDAESTINALAGMESFIGGRALPPREDSNWRAQLFWEVETQPTTLSLFRVIGSVLPENMNYRLLLPSIAATLQHKRHEQTHDSDPPILANRD